MTGTTLHDPSSLPEEASLATQPDAVNVERIRITPATYTDPNRPRTAGEKKVSNKIHFWVDFVINSLASIALVSFVQLKFGDTYKGWKEGVRNNKLLSGFSDTAKDIASARFVGLFTLSMLGHFLMVPIKKLKDRELELVQKADQEIDGNRKLTVREQKDRAIAHTAIELKPKQTVKTMAISRVGSLLLANWLPFITLDVLLTKRTGKDLDKGYIEPAAGKIAEKMKLGGRGTHVMQTVMAVTIMEIISCALTALGVKAFMTWQEKRHGRQTPKPEETIDLVMKTTADGQLQIEKHRGGAGADIAENAQPPVPASMRRAFPYPSGKRAAARPAASHEDRYAQGRAEAEAGIPSPAI